MPSAPSDPSALSSRLASLLAASIALAAILVALWQLEATRSGVQIETLSLGDTPVTIFRPPAPRGPVVLLAHGFAGSQQLMQPFAVTFARGGYTAVTFDLPGHGRNRAALTGSITQEDGATRTLVKALADVATYARGLGDGRLAVLGHSMSTDVVIRFAEETPDVGATIAVSMFSPVVTATEPRDLLVIVGDWETTLKREALRAVGLATAPATPLPAVTYGDVAAGSGRRAAFSPDAEHVAVLYSRASMREAIAWLDAAFGTRRDAPPYLDARGGFIVLLLAGIVALGWPLARMLPVVRPRRPLPLARAAWRRRLVPLLVPALFTPLLLRVVPTHFLPVLVGDYLAVHFFAYGLLTALCSRWASRSTRLVAQDGSLLPRARGARIAGATLVSLYALLVLGGAIDRYVTSFVPTGTRWPLLGVMLVGTSCYFVTDEQLTRADDAPRGVYIATKLAFLVSLGLAVVLDFERLFFLVLIVPVVVVFFTIFGLWSTWSYRRTGDPLVGGIAAAAGFAWAIGVSFPLIAG